MAVHACTIIARNYLAQVRVLAESFRRHHPDGTIDVLHLDEHRYPLASNEPFTVVTPAELGLDDLELRRMAAIYSVLELATALKPWLLQRLLERRDHVLYLDPDIEVHGPLDDVSRLARQRTLVLTPHLTAPLVRREAEPTETTILFAGIYNLGFIGVSRAARAVLDWWAERLRRECVVAPRDARFVDQRWLDLLPGFRAEHHVLRDPAVNVAWWNLPRRRFAREDGGYTVDDRPLTFFHFSGYDPRAPHLLSRHQGDRPKVLLSEEPALRRICGEYAEQLYAHGFEESIELPYGFDELAGGMPVTPEMRSLLRAALRAAEEEGLPAPPVPFDLETEHAFIDWLREVTGPGAEPRVPRYLRHLWAHRPELQRVFPDLRWSDGGAYLAWVAGPGRTAERIPAELVPSPGALRGGERAVERPPQRGVNLLLHVGDDPDGAELAGALASALGDAGVPHAVGEPEAGPVAAAAHDLNLVCVAGERLAHTRHELGPSQLRDRLSVAAWTWDGPAVSGRLTAAFATFDEVWVPSAFVADAAAQVTEVPLHVLPVRVEAPPEPSPPRGELGLPEGFLVVVLVDLAAGNARQNAPGAIVAFARAFDYSQGARLYVHGVNAERDVNEAERLHEAVRDLPGAVFASGPLPPARRRVLLASADCVLSLHRSTGFGRALAEAMAAGTPTVATRFGGNMEFMTDANAYLVDWEPAPVPAEQSATWAQPDLDDGAEALQQVLARHEEAAERAGRARREMHERYGVEATATFVSDRLEALRAGPRAAAAR